MESIKVVFVVASLVAYASCQICGIEKAPLAVKNDCTSYDDCSTGVPVRKSCPSGQYFSCMNHKCGNASMCWSRCCENDHNHPNGSNFCNKNGVKVKYNCGEYDQCTRGVMVTKNCPNGQEFNSYNYTCMTPFTRKCKANTTTSPTSTPTSTTTSTTTNTTTTPTLFLSAINSISAAAARSTRSISFCTSNGAKIVNPEKCHQYYECGNGTVILNNCTIGKFFNSWTSKCEYGLNPPSCTPALTPFGVCPNNGTITSNPKNCAMYFECHNYWIMKKSCNSGQEFDQWKKECVTQGLASCPDTPCGLVCKINNLIADISSIANIWNSAG